MSIPTETIHSAEFCDCCRRHICPPSHLGACASCEDQNKRCEKDFYPKISPFYSFRSKVQELEGIISSIRSNVEGGEEIIEALRGKNKKLKAENAELKRRLALLEGAKGVDLSDHVIQ